MRKNITLACYLILTSLVTKNSIGLLELVPFTMKYCNFYENLILLGGIIVHIVLLMISIDILFAALKSKFEHVETTRVDNQKD